MGQQRLYKVLPQSEWRVAEADGVFRGSGIDHIDGFIHLSSPEQVVETVEKHFAGQRDLLLVAVGAQSLGATLRWERSRGDDLFPHVYGEIPLTAVVEVVPLPLGSDGKHEFPAGL